MTPFAISGWLLGITSVGFGTFVLLKTTDRPLGRVWFGFTVAVAGWGWGCVAISAADDAVSGLLAWKGAYALGVLWIAPLFYHFTTKYLVIHRPRHVIFHYAVATIFLCLLPGHLFFKDVRWAFDTFMCVVIGPVYPLFIVWWLGLVGYGHWLMLQSYRHAPTLKKAQLRYFLIATLIGFGGGITTFLIDFGLDVYPYGNFAIPLYPFIMSFAILRYRLFSIDVFIRKAIVYSTIVSVSAAVYATILIALSKLFENYTRNLGMFSAFVPALVIAVLFHPLRSRIQRWVDRHFPRESLDQELLREATSGFVHEIKKPLANISMPAQLALAEIDDLKTGKLPLADGLQKVAGRLEFIVRESMEAGGRMEALRELLSAAAPIHVLIDLKAVIQRARDLETRRAERAGVQLLCQLDDALWVLGNDKQLEIALINLLKNGIEAAELQPDKHPSLVIRGRRVGDEVEIAIRDSGPGIEKQHLGQIFESAFSTKGIRGMGIGLSLVREIVRLHNGAIQVESELGQGSTFLIILPAAEAQQSVDGRSQ